MIEIAICICTRRRKNGIKALLDSVQNIIVPENVSVNIVIVENDDEGFTESLIVESAAKSKFPIHYFLERKQGIAFARNRAVLEAGNCQFCCFVDDDQIVDHKWLFELLKCQKEYNADAVWGKNPPLFSSRVPEYIVKFHTPANYKYGEIVQKASTNCLLVKKDWLDKISGPFDLKLNFAGGEDSYFTRLITQNGGIIRFNPDALAFEVIPESRTTIKYFIKRTIRTANAQSLVNSMIYIKYSKIKTLPRLFCRLVLGIIIIIPYFIFGKENKLLGLFKISYSIGGILFVFGQTSKFYK